MPEWRELYIAAISEPHPATLERFIKQTEEAAFVHLQELGTASQEHGERCEIVQAMKILLALKTEKLR